ncbi:MAG: Zn-ribbon domain-containing OB-fold protein [Nitrospirota bacterium]
MDTDRWIKIQNERTGIREEEIKRAFSDEIEGKTDINAPLEIPDKIEIFYRYSYGGISRFFRELRDNKKILGSRCEGCGMVYLPPRINCSKCYLPTDWVTLGGEGTVVTLTTVHYATSRFFHNVPFICGYIKMDGADTLILQNIIMEDIREARPGMRVKAIFKEERSGDIGDFYFEPI